MFRTAEHDKPTDRDAWGDTMPLCDTAKKIIAASKDRPGAMILAERVSKIRRQAAREALMRSRGVHSIKA